MSAAAVRDAFKFFDKDGSGQLSKESFRALLQGETGDALSELEFDEVSSPFSPATALTDTFCDPSIFYAPLPILMPCTVCTVDDADRSKRRRHGFFQRVPDVA